MRTLIFRQTVTEVARTSYNPAGVCVTTVLLDTPPGAETFLADFSDTGDALAPLRRADRWMAQMSDGQPYRIDRRIQRTPSVGSMTHRQFIERP